MKHPPRDPKESMITRRHWVLISGYGFLITASVLGALDLALICFGRPDERAVTISFLTLAFAQLWHVFNMRERHSNWFLNDITCNKYVWGALALCTGLPVSYTHLTLPTNREV